MGRAFKAFAVAAARAAWDKKGQNVAVLEVARISPITDFLLLTTALSAPHLEALEVEIAKAAKGFRLNCLHRAGSQSTAWRVLDFGGLVVHLMTAETRGHYALEKLFDDAPRVKWQSRRGAVAAGHDS